MQEPDLLSSERHALIEARLQSEGRVLAGVLADELNVSVDTIRRDLRDLAASGKCVRVYGGALPPAPRAGNHQKRISYLSERKLVLAKTAAAIIKPGMTVFVDAGTTNLAIAKAIPADVPVTLITNAPAISAEVLNRPHWRLIQVGGEVDLAIGAALGAMAMRDMASLLPDISILGTCGFDLDAGLTAHSLEESEFKRYVAGRSAAVLAAVTSDKLKTRAPFAFMDAGSLTHLVVEPDADEAIINASRNLGVGVHVAEPRV